MNCTTAMSHTAVMCEINAQCSHDVAILLTKLRTANGTKKAATLPPSLDNQHLHVCMKTAQDSIYRCAVR